jgi:hypothetical protein
MIEASEPEIPRSARENHNQKCLAIHIRAVAAEAMNAQPATEQVAITSTDARCEIGSTIPELQAELIRRFPK